MNLTKEQRDLLKEIVAQYDQGRRGEFILSLTMDGTHLLYPYGGPGRGGNAVSLEADEADFQQLAAESLVTLIQRDNSLAGKPTELGIQLVHRGELEVAVGKYVARTVNRENGRVFIGHGHSPVWKELRDFLEKRLDLSTDDFNREPTAGMSTTEVLQQKLDDAGFAFLVMTGEDSAGDGTVRARENVVHEIGLFQGRLGLHRAIVLQEVGCTAFSNIHGLTVVPFRKNEIMSITEEIRKVLEREGIVR